jgi:hypothetical protein
MEIKHIEGYGEGTFEDVISQFEKPIAEISKKLRELVAIKYPGVIEVVWKQQKIVGYGIGPKKMSEHFTYIAPFKNHVNLGFYYGTKLPDPQQLLSGTGKKLRHVKIFNLSDITFDIGALIESSIKNIRNKKK